MVAIFLAKVRRAISGLMIVASSKPVRFKSSYTALLSQGHQAGDGASNLGQEIATIV